jgi:hypothetical protein
MLLGRNLSLLKNELGAIGWGHAERPALPISRGSTLIAMMQSADLGEGDNIACGGKLHATDHAPWWDHAATNVSKG